MRKANYEVLRYPSSRLGTVDLGRIGMRKHHVVGLLEVDVTDVISRVRAIRAEGRRVSLFATITKAISKTIEENRYIHALKIGLRAD